MCYIAEGYRTELVDGDWIFTLGNKDEIYGVKTRVYKANEEEVSDHMS